MDLRLAFIIIASLLWRGLLMAVAGLLAVPLFHPSRSLLGRVMVAVGRQGGTAGRRPQPEENRERKTCPEQGGGCSRWNGNRRCG